MMKIWSLITYGMDNNVVEVSLEQAVDNYMSILHSPNEQVIIHQYFLHVRTPYILQCNQVEKLPTLFQCTYGSINQCLVINNALRLNNRLKNRHQKLSVKKFYFTY